MLNLSDTTIQLQLPKDIEERLRADVSAGRHASIEDAILHAMLHRQEPPLTIEELRTMLRQERCVQRLAKMETARKRIYAFSATDRFRIVELPDQSACFRQLRFEQLR